MRRENIFARCYVTSGNVIVALKKSYLPVPVAMKFFQHRYYRLGKILMCLIGQWPYQSNRARYGILAVFVLFLAYQVGSQIVAVVTYRHDWNVLLECLIPNVFDALCTMKYLSFMWNSRNVSRIFKKLQYRHK